MDKKIRVGVSSCLIGQEVRHDGGHCRSRDIVEILGDHFSYHSICPEMAAGMGAPRESIHQEMQEGRIRLIGNRSGIDWTRQIEKASAHLVKQIQAEDLCGFIVKRKSPTCGGERVRVQDGAGSNHEGIGVFTRMLKERYPKLPVEEEGRLNDPFLREHFISRVFAIARLRAFFSTDWTLTDLMNFHATQKLQLMGFAPAGQKRLGRLIANANNWELDELKEQYSAGFLQVIGARLSRGKHVNVLQHMAGYVSRQMELEERYDLSRMIHQYEDGLVPLIVPVSLLRHHVIRFNVEYLASQVYLQPYPEALMLMNRI
jgi:uncharacterized protein YbgA (DUF1722 family)/uncharacterized protein YbbK (DUF523 family)